MWAFGVSDGYYHFFSLVSILFARISNLSLFTSLFLSPLIFKLLLLFLTKLLSHILSVLVQSSSSSLLLLCVQNFFSSHHFTFVLFYNGSVVECGWWVFSKAGPVTTSQMLPKGSPRGGWGDPWVTSPGCDSFSRADIFST
jgi:hypothetical protein